MKDKKKENRKRSKIILSAAGVAVVLFCVFSLIAIREGVGFSGAFDRIASVFTGGSGVEEFYYDNADGSVFAELEGGVAQAGAGGLRYIHSSGEETKLGSYSMAQPVLSSNGTRAVLYDVGGKDVCVFDEEGILADLDSEIAVISASLNKKGWLVLCEQAKGYNGAVKVYNSSGNPVYEWYSGSGYVLSAALSSDNKKLAVLTVTKEGGELVFFKLDSTEEQGRYKLPGELMLDVCFLDNDNAAVLTDSMWLLVGTDGELQKSYDFEGKFLNRFSMDGNGFTTIVLSDYQVGSSMEVLTISKKGEVTGKLETEREITGLSVRGKYIAVLFSDGLGIYDNKMNEKAVWMEDTGGTAVLAKSNGDAIVVGTYSAKVYYR